MTNKPILTSTPRRFVVLGLMVLAAGVLIWHVANLQIHNQAFLKRQGDARFLRVVDIPAHRGRVLDRHGDPLAVSAPVASVWAVPAELIAAPDRWADLAMALEMPEKNLAKRITERAGRGFMYIRRQVTPAVAARVRDLGVPGVYLRREYRRYYPAGEVAAHVVGFTNVDDVGQEGMELAFEPWLQGVPGARRVIRDRLGRVVEGLELVRKPKPGKDLYLSLDRRVQFMAYRALKATVKRHRARGGSVVVMDATTGEVLAMVNQPAYNPNNRVRQDVAGFRNRAVTDVFEPGSTIKPLTLAAALESGAFRPRSTVDTRPGHFKVGRYTVKDPRNYGVIDLGTIIKKSSNVGAAKVALAIAPRALWRILAGVGFGQPLGSGFPGEAAGTLTHFDTWGDIQRATLAYGYGVSVTALQLAQAYATLANGGRVIPASFQRVDRAVQGQRVMSEQVARAVRRMMLSVTSSGGTGRRARVPDYQVAGKTGTVKKATAGGYADDRYTALFVGMLPADRPRLVTVVTVDEPRGEQYYGGQVAAPVFAAVMTGAARVLGLVPDEPGAARQLVSVSLSDPGASVLPPGAQAQ